MSDQSMPKVNAGYGSRGVPQAGIGGDDTLVFVIDIISTR